MSRSKSTDTQANRSKKNRPGKRATRIPKPKQPAAMFKKYMTLAEVVAICEEDAGCGFALKGSRRGEFYFLDDQWRERADTHPHAPMMARFDCTGVSWSTTVHCWEATSDQWRLVDLTKHPRFVAYMKAKYVGQGNKRRYGTRL